MWRIGVISALLLIVAPSAPAGWIFLIPDLPGQERIGEIELFEDRYRLPDETLTPLLNALCKCRFSATKGTYTIASRQEESHDELFGRRKESGSNRSTRIFTGPLGVLGPAEPSADGNLL